MSTCEARLPIPYFGVSESGWPTSTAPRRCTQTVGVRGFWDHVNRERHYCSLAGHLGDVLAQAQADELCERVRHETRPEPRAFDRTEYSPNYRAAMVDAGRGGLLR